jgi:predicted phage terminase large subunit-like protein
VVLVRGKWNEPFIDELCNFPAGHDDQVDAASGAFEELVSRGTICVGAIRGTV